MLHTSTNPHESRPLGELIDFARGLHRPSAAAGTSGAAHEEDLLAPSYFTAVCTAMFKEDRIPKADRFLLYEVLLALPPSTSSRAAATETGSHPHAPVYASRAAAFEAERLAQQEQDATQHQGGPHSSAVSHHQSLQTCVRRAIAGLHAWVPPVIAGASDDTQQTTDTPHGYVAELEGLTAYVCARLGVTDAQHVAFVVVAIAQSLYHEHASTASPSSGGKKRSGKGGQSGNTGGAGDATSAVGIPAARFAPTAPAPGWAERVFRVVYALQARFPAVPPHPDAHAVAVELLRLLLQYHDPALSMHLDRCKTNAAGHVLSAWAPSLCALLLADPAALAACDTSGGDNTVGVSTTTSPSSKWEERDEYHEAAPFLSLIDFVLATRDPVVLPALCIEVLKRNRERLLALQSRPQLLEAFGRIRLDPTSTDVRVLAVHGQQQLRMTPKSVCAMLHRALFQDAVAAAGVNSIVEGATSAGGVSGSEMSVAGADGIFSVRDQAERLKSFIALPVTTAELVETFGAATTSTSPAETPSTSFAGANAAAAAAAGATGSGSQRTSPQDRVAAGSLVLRCGAVSAQPSLQYHPRPLSYVILDCRAERSFNFARLPTAIHVGTNVGYDPALMRSMVERFEGARGSHLCLLGTGRGLVEEANLLKIIALQFLQHGFPFVSIAEGGFQGLIPHIRAGEVEVVRTVDEVAGPSQSDAAQPSSPLSTSRGHSEENGPEELANKAKEKASALADEAKEKAAALAEEAKQTAEVAKAKISQNLEAAKSWGLSLFSRIGKQDTPTPAVTPTATATPAAATTTAATASASPAPAVAAPTVAAPSGPAAFAAAAVSFFSAADTRGREELAVTPTMATVMAPSVNGGAAATQQHASPRAMGGQHTRSTSGASGPAAAAAAPLAATPFQAGGAASDEDDDEDLMATLVSTVPKPKAPEPKPVVPEPVPPVAVAERSAADAQPEAAAPEAAAPAADASPILASEETGPMEETADVVPVVAAPPAVVQQHVDPSLPAAAAEAVEVEPSPLLSGDLGETPAFDAAAASSPQGAAVAPVEMTAALAERYEADETAPEVLSPAPDETEVPEVPPAPAPAAVEVHSPAELPDVAPANPLAAAPPKVAPAAPAPAATPHPFDDMFD